MQYVLHHNDFILGNWQFTHIKVQHFWITISAQAHVVEDIHFNSHKNSTRTFLDQQSLVHTEPDEVLSTLKQLLHYNISI